MINTESYINHAYVLHFLAKPHGDGESIPVGIVQSLHNFSSPLLRCSKCSTLKAAAVWDAMNLDMFEGLPSGRFSYPIGYHANSAKIIVPPSVFFTRTPDTSGNYVYRCPACGEIRHINEIIYEGHSTIAVQPLRLMERLASLTGGSVPDDFKLHYSFYLTGVSGVPSYLDIYDPEMNVSLPITQGLGKMQSMSFVPTRVESGLPSLINDTIRTLRDAYIYADDASSVESFKRLFVEWHTLLSNSALSFDIVGYLSSITDLEISEEQIKEAITFGIATA